MELEGGDRSAEVVDMESRREMEWRRGVVGLEEEAIGE